MTHVTYEVITPTDAAKLLARVHPRQKGRDSQTIIDGFADLIKAGQWNEAVAQTISIDDAGNLVDGWHRLNAICRAGVPLRLWVARGVSPSAFANYDSGFPRSLAFRLGLHKDLIAVITMVVKTVHYGRHGMRVTNDEAFLTNDFIGPCYGRFVEYVGTTKKARISSAAIRTGVVLSAMRFPASEEAIFQAYKNYVVVNLTDAPRSMSSLYRRLTENHYPQNMQLVLAWRAFCPARFNDSKLQISDMVATIQEIRQSVLRDLVICLAGEERLSSVPPGRSKRMREKLLDDLRNAEQSR